jgi:hypothetical protein
MCTYQLRQEMRLADDHGFGFTPPMSEKQFEAREEEDRNDPPCGQCPTCKEAEQFEAEWEPMP